MFQAGVIPHALELVTSEEVKLARVSAKIIANLVEDPGSTSRHMP